MIKMPDFRNPYIPKKDSIYIPNNQDYLTMRKGGSILEQPIIPPGNPRDQLTPYEREMMMFKKGGKPRRKKSKTTKGMTQIQKVNIKIGDLSKLLPKKNDDTAILMKQKGQTNQPLQTSTSTYLRLESPPFKFMSPLPSTIPNLYQANPSSISQPLISNKPITNKGGDLQPEIKNPIVVDTDPNDLEKTSIKSHSTRVIPSINLLAGSISGSINDPSLPISSNASNASLSSREAGYIPEQEYKDLYAPDEGGYIIGQPYDEKRVVRTRMYDDKPYTLTMSEKDEYIPKSSYYEKGPLKFSTPTSSSSSTSNYPFTGRGPRSKLERQQEESLRHLIHEDDQPSSSLSFF